MNNGTKGSIICFALVAGLLTGTAYAWSPTLLASGGDSNYIWYAGPTEAYGVHVYTNTSGGTFTPEGSLNVEYLVVAGGGGGGGSQYGGGGGAGGLLTNSASSLLTISLPQTITVGSGGSGGGFNGVGSPGTDSSIGTNVVAKGGGAGQSVSTGNANGGSGGGGSFFTTGRLGGTNYWSGSQRQGYNGGKGSPNDGGVRSGGGGGGAGGTGVDAADNTGGNGGPGVTNSITGVATAYAGGGGGGDPITPFSTGGSGGGGNALGGSGVNGLGGGGGGGSNPAGRGGSGIVVIRYLIPFTEAPIILNQSVTSVTTNSATFNGWLDDTNTSPTTVCVLWGPQNGGSAWTGWANTNWFNGNGWTNDTTFSTNITGLTPDITYYYTYAAVNAISNAVAPGVKTFITGAVTVNATDSAAQYKASPIDTGAYTISRPATATNEAVTVNYALSGSMTNGVHYTLSGSATISAGAASTVLTLTPTYVGSGGNAVLTLTTGAANNYPVGVSPNDQAIVTISAPALPASVLVVQAGTPGVTPTEPYGTWATAAMDIQTAVNFAGAVAATHPTFNTVTVSNGTYTGTILITNAVTVQSYGNGVYGGLANASNTVVDAGGAGRVFSNGNANAILDGLTIQNGYGGDHSGNVHGLGVYMNGGLVRNCIIKDNNKRAVTGNSNNTSGGGAYVTGGGTVSNCVIRRNLVNVGGASMGGGVYVDNGLITHCQILNNTNNNIYGGGVYMNGASAILRNCLIAGNYVAGTAQGGGVCIGSGAIQSCTIVTNSTATGNGAGVYLGGGTVSNSIVYFNTVGGVHSNLNTTAGLYYSCSINPGTNVNGNITDTPLFASPAGGDYTLQKSSPCIDAGTNQTWMSGAKDLAGSNRLLKGNKAGPAIVDMGAYETYVPPKGSVFMMR